MKNRLKDMRHPVAGAVLCLASIFVGGCGRQPAATFGISPEQAPLAAAVTEEWGAKVLKVRVSVEQTWSLNSATASLRRDVQRVIVTLSRETGTPVAELEVRVPDDLSRELVFGNLRSNATYIVQGTAIGEDGDVLSEPSRSRTRIVMESLPEGGLVRLNVALADRLFAGTAGVAFLIRPGAVSGAMRGVVAWLAGAPAALPSPRQVVVRGDEVLVADPRSHRIIRITGANEVTTLAGTGTEGFADGAAASASFSAPEGLALTAAGEVIVADTGNHAIRRIDREGTVHTLAGNGMPGTADAQGTLAAFNGPRGVAVDARGTIYVADTGNHRLRVLTADGMVTTLAGGDPGFWDGPGAWARFNEPSSVAVDPSDGSLWVADTENHRIRLVSPQGQVRSVAGLLPGFSDGPVPLFRAPRGVLVGQDARVYVADTSNNRIRVVSRDGRVRTLAGSSSGFSDGTGSAARLSRPTGIASGPGGNLLVADSRNGALRWMSSKNAVTTHPAADPRPADGTRANARFGAPSGLREALDGRLVVADALANTIREVGPGDRVETLAGDGTPGLSDGPVMRARFRNPTDVVEGPGGIWFVADQGNNAIRRVLPSGVVDTFVGGDPGRADGWGRRARFRRPTGLALAPNGDLVVADRDNHVIRRITQQGKVSTLGHGSRGFADGQTRQARFDTPVAVAVDRAGTIYVADQGNHRIRAISPGGRVTTLAGSRHGHVDGVGGAAEFNLLSALTLDPEGVLYAAEAGGDCIRRVAADGTVTTLAGSRAGYADDHGSQGRFRAPEGLTWLSQGGLAVGDTGNRCLRVVR